MSLNNLPSYNDHPVMMTTQLQQPSSYDNHLIERKNPKN